MMMSASGAMKTHSSMATVLARILSEQSDGILSLSNIPPEASQDKNNKMKHPTPVANRKRILSERRDSSSEDENDSSVSLLESHKDAVKRCHLLAGDASLDKEKRLQNMATSAVVQLFNAVHKHQKELESKLEESGSSERQRTKVLSSIDKGGFISHLKKSSRSSQLIQPISSDQCEEDTSWSVLREDFVKGSKYKDWDKTDESLGSICIDSDSASDDSGL